MSADEKKKAADIGEFLDVRNLTVQYTSMGSVIHAPYNTPSTYLPRLATYTLIW